MHELRVLNSMKQELKDGRGALSLLGQLVHPVTQNSTSLYVDLSSIEQKVVSLSEAILLDNPRVKFWYTRSALQKWG